MRAFFTHGIRYRPSSQVILVLDHDEKTFTKGIILNRPSGRMMDDDVNEGVRWPVWYGGDVQGLDSLMPDIVCLHSLKSKEATDASNSVMKDIQVSARTSAQHGHTIDFISRSQKNKMTPTHWANDERNPNA